MYRVPGKKLNTLINWKISMQWQVHNSPIMKVKHLSNIFLSACLNFIAGSGEWHGRNLKSQYRLIFPNLVLIQAKIGGVHLEMSPDCAVTRKVLLAFFLQLDRHIRGDYRCDYSSHSLSKSLDLPNLKIFPSFVRRDFWVNRFVLSLIVLNLWQREGNLPSILTSLIWKVNGTQIFFNAFKKICLL